MQSFTARLSFGTALAATMGASTLALAVFGLLAPEFIGEFGVERWQIGILVTANSLAGALVSPSIGAFTDRFGARRATILTLVLGLTSLSTIALAPAYWALTVGAMIGGLSQGLTNPATNKLISLHVAPGRRGVITGIKQSGVQFGTFLAGLVLPWAAALAGWRVAVGIFAGAAAMALVHAVVTLPPDPQADTHVGRSGRDRLPAFIYRLAVYGFLLGAAGTSIFTYLPLFAQEQLGLDPTVAGRAVALTGFTGIIARISWGRAAEMSLGARRSLLIIAVIAVLAAVTMMASTGLSWLIWPAAVFTGASASSWNSVGMLAIIQNVPSWRTGRGSGVVLLGFLAGLGVGSPLFGWSVDRLGTYTPGWIVVAVVFALGWVTMRLEPDHRRGSGLRP